MFDNTQKTPRSVWRTLVCVAFGLMTSLTAYAADPVNGKALYLGRLGTRNNTCSSCHNADPSRNVSKVKNGANAPTVISRAITNNVGGMNEFVGKFTSAEVADMAAFIGNPKLTGLSGTVSVAPTSLSFASQAVNTAASAQTVTVSNTSTTSTLTLSGLTIGGTNAADFSQTGGTCTTTTTLAASGSCTVVVGFTPKASGARAGTLTIASNATNPSVVVNLTGTGAALLGSLSASSTSVAFGSQAINTATLTQTVTLSNTGNGATTFTSFTAGGTHAADFSKTGGTCAVATPLASGGSCTLILGFRPTATGVRAGTLTVASNATNASLVITLGGTGTAAIASVSPASVGFGSALVGNTSAAQTITLSNSGTAALSITSLTSSAASEFKITGGTCTGGGTVAINGSCTVIMDFTPLSNGARTATLSIAHSATGSPTTVALSGTGTVATPAIQVSPSALSWAQTVATTSVAQTVTITNTGTGTLNLQTIAFGGTSAAEYTKAPSSTCAAGGTVAVGGSCDIQITFRPTAVGARSANLNITHNAAGSPSSVALNGSGTAAPQGLLQVDQSSLTFAAQALTTASTAKVVTLKNTGAASMTLSDVALSGAQAADFTTAGTCNKGGALAVNATCTVTVSYSPKAIGSSTASLTLTTTGSNPTVVIGLGGTATAAPAPVLSLSPNSLSFASVQLGNTSSAQTITLSNTGTANMSLSGIVSNGTVFAQTNTCPTTLAPSGSCQISVIFAPTTVGNASGTLTITSNAAGSPQSVALTGVGTAVPLPQASWSATSVNFASTVTVGSVSSETLTLSNAGPGALIVQTLAVQGANAGDFSVTYTNCGTSLPFTLAANASCQVDVTFSPSTAGASTATLGIVHNGQGAASLALSGQGATATVTPTPAPSGTTSTPASTKSAGAGGCSIGQPDQPTDPIWALLCFGALGVMWWRRRTASV